MKHLGDITKISGFGVPPVDVVIGGSPCQNLSIAGKREGLAGEQSGLFLEQIRLVKEMRNADVQRGRTGQLIRPRYMVWENVPGAFSSNRGEDFRAVLQETIRIAEPDAPDIPLPPKGRWPLADCWYGDGWSVAYRVFDAQFWGVPQRRRRIALVADFGGHAAPEILFVRESVCGDPAEGGTAGEETAAGTGDGAYPAVARSLTAGHDGSPCVDRGPNIVVAGFKPHAGVSAGSIGYQEETAPTIDTGKPMAVYDARGNGDWKTACTLTRYHQSRVPDYTAIVMRQHNFGEYREGVGTLTAHNGTRHASETLVVDRNVRRLTPLECERLQGYPDGWTDIGPWTDSAGKLHRESSDSARYTALGNSIALPPWKWVLKRLCACYERNATMASLFDGIGGFPLIWERLNGPGSCLWASEIGEFPVAVTKKRFCGK